MKLERFLPQLEREYRKWLKERAQGLHFSPFSLRGIGKPPAMVPAYLECLRFFQELEKKPGIPGWRISWRNIKHPVLNKQLWPEQLSIESVDDLVLLCKKKTEWQQYESQLQRLLKWKPTLGELFARKPDWVLKYNTQWPMLMEVIDYLLQHDVSSYYFRDLPVAVPTKFIETHQSVLLELLVCLKPELSGCSSLEEAVNTLPKNHFHYPIRFLDRQLAASILGNLNALALTVQEFQKLNWAVERIVVIENEISYLQFPLLPNTLAVWGKGLAVLALQNIPMFEKAMLYYWSDLDEEGYRMLNGFRKLYPHTSSFLMEEATLWKNKNWLGVQGSAYGSCNFSFLKEEETKALRYLTSIQGRLEQEKIPMQQIVEALNQLRGSK